MAHTLKQLDYSVLQQCMHCGMCLPTCPTYDTTKRERNSPRGRIALMRAIADNELTISREFADEMSYCLGCLACETACPSGVAYRDLISPFRAWSEDKRDRPLIDRLRRWLLLRVLPYPGRFRFMTRLGLLARPFGKLLPSLLQPALELLPESLPRAGHLLDRYEAHGTRRARVALLTGCAQQVLAPEINAATIRVLQSQGVEVLIPRDQTCCGALAWHVGDAAQARQCATANLAAFPEDVDAILTNAAGCGSALHEYPLILGGTNSEVFAGKVKDVAQYLHELGFIAPPSSRAPLLVAMQDACHLLHGQRVQSAPRRLLQRVPGVSLREIADAELCCGSAGTYNLDQPAIAASGADCVVTGNIGCLMQLRTHLKHVNPKMRVLHTMVLLDELIQHRHPATVS